MWPGPFGIDEVWRQRRNPSPVIDASIQQFVVIRSREIRRRLNVHVWHQQASNGHGAKHLSETRLPPTMHRNAGFYAEVLHDDFLNVAITLVQIANCQESIDAIFERLPNADQ